MRYLHHEPVMPNECINGLNIKPDGIYVDCTMGGAGHSSLIAERLSSGMLIAIDRDDEAIQNGQAVLGKYGEHVTIVNDNFSNIKNILDNLGLYEAQIDGFLLDLGVSSHQLDSPERGFSYITDAALDMRMDATQKVTAYDIVNGYSDKELADIFFKYGEERFSRQIAKAIIRNRANTPIKTTIELRGIIESALPPAARHATKHPSKRCFQAIRIAVNDELSILEKAIETMIDRLKFGGRICVITFHSLEDRIIKESFLRAAKPCTCPPDFPVCVCKKVPKLQIITRKPTLPTQEELDRNSRSQSAKLRIGQKI